MLFRSGRAETDIDSATGALGNGPGAIGRRAVVSKGTEGKTDGSVCSVLQRKGLTATRGADYLIGKTQLRGRKGKICRLRNTGRNSKAKNKSQAK